jgi:hypothetical protein
MPARSPVVVERRVGAHREHEITNAVELLPVAAAALDLRTGTDSSSPPATEHLVSHPPAQPSDGGERIVHVRIGTIEIQAANTPPAAAAPPPATSQARAADAFDDFAPLRSYAPWAW